MGGGVFSTEHIYTPSKIKVLLGGRQGSQCLSTVSEVEFAFRPVSKPEFLPAQQACFPTETTSPLTSHNNPRNTRKSSLLALFHKQENGVSKKSYMVSWTKILPHPKFSAFPAMLNSTPGWPLKSPEEH